MGLSSAGVTLGNRFFSLGNGLSSVEAWFSTALDIEEVLSGVGGDQVACYGR